MDPRHFDFNLKSISYWQFVYPFSRLSLYSFPCGFILLSQSSSLYWTSLFLHHSSSTYLAVSGALAPFPYSLAPLLPYSTSISLTRLAYWSVRGESQRTCLFINVSEGKRWRRKKSGEQWGEGRGKREEMWQREKVGKCEERESDKSTATVNWWRGLVRRPQGLLTATESSITPEMEI